MNLSHEEFQKARRISRAIQEYLERINKDGLRSTDIYPVLARKNLVEKDRHNGIHFRRFLNKLKDNDLMNLIPQCHYEITRTNFMEWYFCRIKEEQDYSIPDHEKSRKLIAPKISEIEINKKIEILKNKIDELPKIDTSELTPQMTETRNNYPRAYEKWTETEIEIMAESYMMFRKVDKVAELLKRQPSAVRKRLALSNYYI